MVAALGQGRDSSGPGTPVPPQQPHQSGFVQLSRARSSSCPPGSPAICRRPGLVLQGHEWSPLLAASLAGVNRAACATEDPSASMSLALRAGAGSTESMGRPRNESELVAQERIFLLRSFSDGPQRNRQAPGGRATRAGSTACSTQDDLLRLQGRPTDICEEDTLLSTAFLSGPYPHHTQTPSHHPHPLNC